jgi:hypothetical protein
MDSQNPVQCSNTREKSNVNTLPEGQTGTACEPSEAAHFSAYLFAFVNARPSYFIPSPPHPAIMFEIIKRQFLCSRTLSILLVLTANTFLETAFDLRIQLKSTQLGRIDSGGRHVRCGEIEANSKDWAQLCRFHLKAQSRK